MNRVLSVAALLVVAACSQAQSWMLKAPYEAKSKFLWKVVVNANLSGMEIEATMKQHLDIESKDDKQIKGTSAWTDVEVNGQPQANDDDPWSVVLNPDGSLISANGSLDYGRMLVPPVFIYPNKEVKVGDKWTVKFKPGKDGPEVTSDYEVMEMTKVGDQDAMKIKAKTSEPANKTDDAMKSENLFWVGKDGKVLKFELDIKNWVVPMAQGMPAFDAKVKGELVKD